MKNILFATALLLFYIDGAAQSVSYAIKSSDGFEQNYDSTLLFAKEDDKGDLFVVRNFYSSFSNPKGYYIEHYDEDLKLLDRIEILNHRSELRGLLLMNDKVVLIEFRYVQEEKSYQFVAYSSNKKKFEFSEKTLISLSRDKIKRYDHYGIREESEFNVHNYYNFGQVATSENDNYFAINLYLINGGNDDYSISVFDKNLALIFNKTIDNITNHETNEIIDDPLLILNDLAINDDDGEVYVLSKYYLNGRIDERKKGKPNYSYEIFKINNSEIKQLSLRIKDKFVGSLGLMIADTDISLFGFYADDTSSLLKIEGQKGITRINIDKKKFEIINRNFSSFSEQFVKDKYGLKKNKGVYYPRLRNFNILKDGSVIALCEESLVEKGNNQVSYHYYDIIAIKMDPAGKLIWSRNINKKQIAGNADHLLNYSYASIISEDLSSVFINATRKIVRNEDGSFNFTSNKKLHQPFYVQIDRDGVLNFNSIFHDLYENTSLEMRFGIQINKNEVLLAGISHGRSKLFKITQI